MSDPTEKHHSRRKFLSLGLLTGAGLVASRLSASSKVNSDEKISMLTQDGKLVEIDKSLLHKAPQKKPATKKDVLRWIHPSKES